MTEEKKKQEKTSNEKTDLKTPPIKIEVIEAENKKPTEPSVLNTKEAQNKTTKEEAQDLPKAMPSNEQETENEKSNTKQTKTKKNKLEYQIIAKEEVKPGMVVRIHQKIVDTNSKGEEKERIQVFQGMVLARNHGKEIGSTITVRKISGNIGVEKIFPLNMPTIEKIELARKYRIKQAKPYYLRTYSKRLSEIKQ